MSDVVYICSTINGRKDNEHYKETIKHVKAIRDKYGYDADLRYFWSHKHNMLGEINKLLNTMIEDNAVATFYPSYYKDETLTKLKNDCERNNIPVFITDAN